MCCAECDSVYHEGCWAELDKCAQFGCECTVAYIVGYGTISDGGSQYRWHPIKDEKVSKQAVPNERIITDLTSILTASEISLMLKKMVFTPRKIIPIFQSLSAARDHYRERGQLTQFNLLLAQGYIMAPVCFVVSVVLGIEFVTERIIQELLQTGNFVDGILIILSLLLFTLLPVWIWSRILAVIDRARMKMTEVEN